MSDNTQIKIFEDRKVRTIWDKETEEWYFSVVDVIAVLTDNARPRKYWNDLKKKLLAEGSELSDKIGQLKMPSSDGKMYKTDVMNTEQLFRLIQSVPSPKAEPFKLWMAQVAKDRLDEWKKRGLKEGVQFATLTDIIYKTWAGKSAKEYKVFKGLKKENLRDNMTNKELVLNMLAELSTKEISEAGNPQNFSDHIQNAVDGATIAKNARLELERKTGKAVVTPLNARDGIGLPTDTKASFLPTNEEEK